MNTYTVENCASAPDVTIYDDIVLGECNFGVIFDCDFGKLTITSYQDSDCTEEITNFQGNSLFTFYI